MLQKLLPCYADPVKMEARIRSVVSEQKRVQGEETLMRNGKVLLVDFIPIIIDGKQVARFWQHLEITERKQAERMLALSEEKFSKAFRSSPYALLLSRLSDGLMLDVNNAFSVITGYGYSEAVGKTTFDLNLWCNADDRISMMREMLDWGKVEGREFQFLKKAGEVMTGLYYGELIVIDNQQCLLSSINDITERKLSEEDLRKSNLELQAALNEVKTLSGLLPICSNCKKIRDDKGYWNQIESYIQTHSDASFTHGICPDCMKRLYPFIDGEEYPNQ
jgi:PAS domain S-box-containing protein